MATAGELIILAAPSCCGKSRFLNQLFDGKLNCLADVLKLRTPISDYAQMTPKEVSELGDQHISRLFLHYAIPTLALNNGNLRKLADDSRLDILKHSGKITVITMLASNQVLSDRLQRRIKKNRSMIIKKPVKYCREFFRLIKLKQQYTKPANVIAAYDEWLAFSHSLPNLSAEWLMLADDEYKLLPLSRWPTLKKTYSAGARVRGLQSIAVKS